VKQLREKAFMVSVHALTEYTFECKASNAGRQRSDLVGILSHSDKSKRPTWWYFCRCYRVSFVSAMAKVERAARDRTLSDKERKYAYASVLRRDPTG